MLAKITDEERFQVWKSRTEKFKTKLANKISDTFKREDNGSEMPLRNSYSFSTEVQYRALKENLEELKDYINQLEIPEPPEIQTPQE